MKPSTNDQIKGNLHELKGKVKEKAGKLTNNPNLAAEGQDENFAGIERHRAVLELDGASWTAMSPR